MSLMVIGARGSQPSLSEVLLFVYITPHQNYVADETWTLMYTCWHIVLLSLLQTQFASLQSQTISIEVIRDEVVNVDDILCSHQFPDGHTFEYGFGFEVLPGISRHSNRCFLEWVAILGDQGPSFFGKGWFEGMFCQEIDRLMEILSRHEILSNVRVSLDN